MNAKVNPHYQRAEILLQTYTGQGTAMAAITLAAANVEASLAVAWELQQRPQVSSQPPAPGATKQIPVEAIKLATRSDKPETDRWVVIGGNFKQYGITVWPEVLQAAGINPGKLKDRGENNPGVPLVAIYTEKANDEGKLVPDKVIEILKAGA